MGKAGNTFTLSGPALAAFLRNQASPDQSVTFLFRGDYGQVFFASKENGTVAGPTLQLVYRSPLPAAPAALAAQSNDLDQITLEWADNAGNETGYVVERRTRTGTFAVHATLPANQTTFLDAGLPEATAFFYRVAAFNAHGNSAYSGEASAATRFLLAAPPNAEAGNAAGTCGATVNVGTPLIPGGFTTEVSAGRSDGLALADPFPVGVTTVTWKATNEYGQAAGAVQTVTVLDQESPVIAVKAEKTTLWVPNSAYRTVRITDFVTALRDNCQGALPVTAVWIVSVSSDEAENAPESGNTRNDIVIAADCQSVNLRAERSGTGNGRVYTLTVAYTDGAGNAGTAAYEVHVPLDINISKLAVKDAVAYTRTGNCPAGPATGARLSAAPVAGEAFPCGSLRIRLPARSPSSFRRERKPGPGWCWWTCWAKRTGSKAGCWTASDWNWTWTPCRPAYTCCTCGPRPAVVRCGS
jgi:hypothetical protein